MRIMLDVTWAQDPRSTIESLCNCLDTDKDRLIITCCTSDQERIFLLRAWLNGLPDTNKSQISETVAGVVGQLKVWQPSGTDAHDVDACLLASVAQGLMADLVFSDMLAQKQQIGVHAIALSQLNLQTTDGRTTRVELIKQCQQSDTTETQVVRSAKARPLRLALLSPFPPARSGVADCSAELVTGLTDYYDLTLIDTTPEDLRDWDETTGTSAEIKSSAWFLKNSQSFDRVVYQLGNSAYHVGMLPTMAKVPGVVALHDMFIADYLHEEQDYGESQMWPEVLLYEHGPKALTVAQNDHRQAVRDYPGNYRVFRDSLGVVLHSNHALALAKTQIGMDVSLRTQLIPLTRKAANAPTPEQRKAARKALGLPETCTIICSFGLITPHKSPLLLLEAWQKSSLSSDPDAHLIFVGKYSPDNFKPQVAEAIASLPQPGRVRVTGFVDAADFTRYLMAADFAVQLRGVSRGETSGAVLHAMAYGVPQIVNANGSFADLDREAVWMLPEVFTVDEIVHAMNTLHCESERRQAMTKRGPGVIQAKHSPTACARAYYDFIEDCYEQRALSHPRMLLTAIKKAWPDGEISAAQRASLSNAIDFNRTALLPRPRLLLDMSSTHNFDGQTGIQRVVLALFDALVDLEPEGLLVTPVYLDQNDSGWHFHQANKFMTKRLGLKEHWLTDHYVFPRSGDILLTLDLSTWHLKQAHEQGLFRQFQASGVRCYSIVYDLLPITMPTVFPPGFEQSHEDWLSVVARLDGAICISKHVASELEHWRRQQADIDGPYRIGSFLLGADTETFKSNEEIAALPSYAPTLTPKTKNPPIFLMVGTVEPRKGYLETINAFLELWASGFDARLIIVGREGWTHLARDERNDIPATVYLLRNHPERFRRLLWLDNADDAVLERSYARADCLIAASYDEGFGLPIIEATRHGVPVLARDIAVFREVAPAGTVFFKNGELAQAIRNWTKPERPPKDEHTITWRESAQQVLQWLNEEQT